VSTHARSAAAFDFLWADFDRLLASVGEEKAIHFSFAIVGYLAPLQAAFLCVGSLLWFANSDRHDQTGRALIAASVGIIMCSFGITIGCAARPAWQPGFAFYGLWQVVAVVFVVVVLNSISDATATCELSLGAGLAPISTDQACPELIARELTSAGIEASQLTTQAAKALCEDGIGAGVCEWSDMCWLATEDQCKAQHPLGEPVCNYTKELRGGECRVADGTIDIVTLHGQCAPTAACAFKSMMRILGVFVCSVAGANVLAILHILEDSRHPLQMQFGARHQQSMFTMAMQMSMDPAGRAAIDDQLRLAS